MSDKSYSNWFKNTLRDPLWWIWILSLIVVALSAILDMVGVIDSDVAPFNAVYNISWAVFGLTLVGVAIRGKDIGEDKPMSTGLRIFSAVLGIFVAVVAIVFGLILK